MWLASAGPNVPRQGARMLLTADGHEVSGIMP